MSEKSKIEFTPEMGQMLVVNTALEPLGAEVTSVNHDEAIITMPITNAARQPMGLLHGGISLLLAESVASLHAAFLVDLSEKRPVGIEVSGSHLNSAREGHIKAVGKVLRQSRSLVVHEVNVYHVESDKHLCSARVTNFYKQV